MVNLNVKGIEVKIKNIGNEKYISLTDIARRKNQKEPRFIVNNWLKNRNTIEFLGIWEKIHNPNFNRIEFDTFRINSGLNSFILSPSNWIDKTKAIGLISRSGRYGSGTFAHEDIALEFASWISAEFKIFFIKEFRRLKEEENKRESLDWNLKRALTKINYNIHKNAIKENLIPKQISKEQENKIYASEEDLLNVAIFGMTAKEWKLKNKTNLRENANVSQLVCLSNLESLNSVLIKEKLPQNKRLRKLNKVAIS